MTKKNYQEPHLKVISICLESIVAGSPDPDNIGFGGGDGDMGDVKGHRRGFSWDDEDEE